MMTKVERTVLIIISILCLIEAAILAGLAPASSGSAVDTALVLELSEQDAWDVEEIADKVSLAESSRQQVIQDSINASVSESESVRRSIEDSVAESISVEESIAASVQESIEQSIEASIAESVSVEESIAESIEASIQESVAASIAESVRESEEASIAASIAQSEAESREEERRQEIARQEAEARRQAAAEAEARRQAEEAARRAAEEEARRASENAANPTAAPPAATGPTVLFGDSRTLGFASYNLYPANLVFYTYNPVSSNPELRGGAAAVHPSNIIFLNGIDDVCVYGAAGALGQYEAYIAAFQAASPGTRIFVHPALAVNGTALAAHPTLGELPAFNAALPDMCARHGWTYIDCSQGYSLAYLGTDGIHYGPDWTAIWLANLRATVGF